MTSAHALSGGVFLAILLGLGISDALLLEPPPITKEPTQVAQEPEPQQPSEPANEPTTGNTSSTQASSVPAGYVARPTGPDIPAILAQQGFSFQATTEPSFLEQLLAETSTTVEKRVLLLNGDRVGILAWTRTPSVKTHFGRLKETLHTAFSPDVQDLQDEIERVEGQPTRNVLTFLDPAISQERVVFVRVREELYEARIAPGNEEAFFTLLDAISQ